MSELRGRRFLDVFEYNGTRLMWACFLCNHPDRAHGFLQVRLSFIACRSGGKVEIRSNSSAACTLADRLPRAAHFLPEISLSHYHPNTSGELARNSGSVEREAQTLETVPSVAHQVLHAIGSEPLVSGARKYFKSFSVRLVAASDAAVEAVSGWRRTRNDVRVSAGWAGGFSEKRKKGKEMKRKEKKRKGEKSTNIWTRVPLTLITVSFTDFRQQRHSDRRSAVSTCHSREKSPHSESFRNLHSR